MSILSINVAASNVEGPLFGIFFALAIASLSLLVHRRWKEANIYGAGPTVSWLATTRGMWRSALFMLTLFFVTIITTHWVLGVCRMFDAVIYYDDGLAAEAYYANLRHPLEVSRTALLIVSKLTGDLILTYRMWIVWNHRYAVAIPAIVTSMGLLASGIGVLYEFTTNVSPKGIFAKQLTRWIIGVAVTTLATELYGTAMISYRIYVVNRSLKNSGLQRTDGGILEILMIFVESSMLSTSGTLFFGLAYASKSELQSFATTVLPAIHGISFVLITVRIGLGWDLQLGVTGPREDPQTATLAPFQTFPLRTIRLTVTTTTQQETDFALTPQAGGRRSSDTALNVHKE